MALEPTNKNFLGQTGFKFVLDRIPNSTYFSQTCNIPGLNFAVSEAETPLLRYPIPGTLLEYAPFSLTFKVDEDLTNYLEIHEWMVGLGYPISSTQRFNFKKTSKNQREASDATLFIMSSKYNPNIRIKFRDMIPSDISDLTFTSTATDIEYLEATVNFRYSLYEIESVDS